MIETTINQNNIPAIYYEEEEKAEIRSIDKMFPEYTMNRFSEYKNNMIDIIYSLYRKSQEAKTQQYLTDTNTISGDAMSKYYKIKNKIKISGHLYQFESSFIYSITKEDEGFIAENEYFNIFGYGNSVDEAEQELYDYINNLWESYVEDNDENLDESAIELKRKIMRNIRKIY